MSYVSLKKQLPALMLVTTFFATAPVAASKPIDPFRMSAKPIDPFRSFGRSAKAKRRLANIATAMATAVIPVAIAISINLAPSESDVERKFGDMAVKDAHAKHYVDEYIHYIDQEGNANIGEVVRTFDDVDGELLKLADGSKIAAEQFRGTSRKFWGWGKIALGDTVFFSTEHAEALNADAQALVADGQHGTIAAEVGLIFSSRNLEVFHTVEDGKAVFLIHRDKIIHYNKNGLSSYRKDIRPELMKGMFHTIW